MDVQHHLLRALPGRCRHLLAGGVRGRDPGPLVLPPAARLRQHHRKPHLPHHVGNLSHQIEHHLFPDLPARRYPEIAEEVREICERYGLSYNTGPLHQQLLGVFKKICKFALPDRKKPAAAEVRSAPALEGVAA